MDSIGGFCATGAMTVRIAYRGSKEWEAVKAIRTQVFIEEQHCPCELEWDKYEEISRHVLGSVDGEPMAAARWRMLAYKQRPAAKLERFSVLREYRGKGYGKALVSWVIEDARRAGLGEFIGHAQQHLEDFYRSFGFQTVGDPFEEVGIPHIMMVRCDSGPCKDE